MARGTRRYGDKEVIKKPNKTELTDASHEMRAGHSSGARVMADKSVWVRQHPKKK